MSSIFTIGAWGSFAGLVAAGVIRDMLRNREARKAPTLGRRR